MNRMWKLQIISKHVSNKSSICHYTFRFAVTDYLTFLILPENMKSDRLSFSFMKTKVIVKESVLLKIKVCKVSGSVFTEHKHIVSYFLIKN